MGATQQIHNDIIISASLNQSYKLSIFSVNMPFFSVNYDNMKNIIAGIANRSYMCLPRFIAYIQYCITMTV